MMGWYQIISFLFTNGLRIFFGLYLVMAVLKVPGVRKRAGVLSAVGAVFITALSCLTVPQIYIAGVEIIILMLIIRRLLGAELRMPLFLIFFYEIAVALWEFMISAGLGILFRSEVFLDSDAPEYMAAVWIVRALTVGIAFLAAQAGQERNRSRSISAVAVAGLFVAQQIKVLISRTKTSN